MAAYDPSELIDAQQAKALNQVNEELKIFLFDKDDTLVNSDKDGSPAINPQEHRIAIAYIKANSKNMMWGILSKGSAGFGCDMYDITTQDFSKRVVDPTAQNWKKPELGSYLVGDDRVPRDLGNGFVNTNRKVIPFLQKHQLKIDPPSSILNLSVGYLLYYS